MFKNSVLKDKDFIRQVFVVALPMVIQQLISSSVNLLDNLMVGQLGSYAIAAVASSNKYIMIISFAMMAIVNAATVFLAQYHGARNRKKMKQSFRYAIVFSTLITSVLILIGLLFKEEIIRFFSDNDNLVELAIQYFPIAALTMLPQSIAFSIQASMRATGNTKLPFVASVISLITNAVMNYVLIFGHFSFPALGVLGAALGTLIARFVELAFLMFALKVNDFAFKTKIRRVFMMPKGLISDITKKAIPLLINEIAWAAGMATLFKLYASSGDISLAALPIASTTSDLFFVLFSGFSVATVVMVSHPLGAGDLEKGRENGYKMVELSVYSALIFAIGMFIASFITPHLYNISDEVFRLAQNFIRVQGVFFFIYMYNAQSFFVIRAGGDTKSTLIMDAGFMWLINIPVVAFFAYYLKASAIMIYISGQLTDIIKMLVTRYYFRKEKWVENLTSEKI